MVFKNVTDLMKRHTALFVILLISQIFALLSIFFVFGVFQNNLYELCDNHDSKSLEATIDNQKITSDDINKSTDYREAIMKIKTTEIKIKLL